MSYIALYRKWRPTTFDEVKGQDTIVTTLKNQIKNNRTGHAYLFCGTRGTGKTTLAKIIARAVNCEHPKDGNPCNECATCQSILKGNSVNVIEIDAASNNGVDNIREIREEVKYTPTEGKYRVYIIDEVHMLSTSAFNALLKTLEEPPSYVMFILATTEVHKVPITVKSRCQRYDLKRFSLQTLEKQIADILESEHIEAEEKAIRFIAQLADGSSRDALSLLEQCLSFLYDEKITFEKVLNVLGAVDTNVFGKLLTYINQKDIAASVQLIDEILENGRELIQFTSDFAWYLRNILMIQTAEGAEDALNLSSDTIKELQEMAMNVSIETLMRYLHLMTIALAEMKHATDKRIVLELSLIKAMKPEIEYDIEALNQRIADLEGMLQTIKQTGVVAYNDAYSSKEEQEETDTEAIQEEVENVVEVVPADYEDLVLLKKEWKWIVNSLSEYPRAMLMDSWISYDRKKGFIACVKVEFNYLVLTKKELYRAELMEKIVAKIQKQVDIHFVLVKNKKQESFVKIKDKEGEHYEIPGIDLRIGIEKE